MHFFSQTGVQQNWYPCFNTASLCTWEGWLESYLVPVAHPKCIFSQKLVFSKTDTLISTQLVSVAKKVGLYSKTLKIWSMIFQNAH